MSDSDSESSSHDKGPLRDNDSEATFFRKNFGSQWQDRFDSRPLESEEEESGIGSTSKYRSALHAPQIVPDLREIEIASKLGLPPNHARLRSTYASTPDEGPIPLIQPPGSLCPRTGRCIPQKLGIYRLCQPSGAPLHAKSILNKKDLSRVLKNAAGIHYPNGASSEVLIPLMRHRTLAEILVAFDIMNSNFRSILDYLERYEPATANILFLQLQNISFAEALASEAAELGLATFKLEKGHVQPTRQTVQELRRRSNRLILPTSTERSKRNLGSLGSTLVVSARPGKHPQQMQNRRKNQQKRGTTPSRGRGANKRRRRGGSSRASRSGRARGRGGRFSTFTAQNQAAPAPSAPTPAPQ